MKKILCYGCHKEKDINAFNRNRSKPARFGRQTHCRECRSNQRRKKTSQSKKVVTPTKRVICNAPKTNTQKTNTLLCYRCNITKDVECFPKNMRQKKRLFRSVWCLDCHHEYEELYVAKSDKRFLVKEVALLPQTNLTKKGPTVPQNDETSVLHVTSEKEEMPAHLL